jgi:hypothetical protein
MLGLFYFGNQVSSNMRFTVFIAIRFPNALGAMVYPIYGQGELPQAFSRRAAVKGCIHVSSSLWVYNLVFLEQHHLLVPYCFLHPAEHHLFALIGIEVRRQVVEKYRNEIHRKDENPGYLEGKFGLFNFK